MTAVLEQHPEVRVLACNIHPFYEEGTQLVQVGSHQTDSWDPPAGKSGARQNVAGAVAARLCHVFRRELLLQLEAIWFPACAHDLRCCGQWGIAVGGAWILNEELIDQRRHSGNNTPSNAKTHKIRAG